MDCDEIETHVDVFKLQPVVQPSIDACVTIGFLVEDSYFFVFNVECFGRVQVQTFFID